MYPLVLLLHLDSVSLGVRRIFAKSKTAMFENKLEETGVLFMMFEIWIIPSDMRFK